MGKRTTIGPWAGIDNVHRPSARSFQIPNWKEKGYASVMAAAEVDINNDGWMISRKPAKEMRVLIDGVGGWNLGGRFFFQEDDKLFEYGEPIPNELLTGLKNRVSMCEHAGLIFITDGVNSWELEGSVVRNWGLPVPELTLGATTGSLEPGLYIVQATFMDERGNTGGVSPMYPITLASSSGISIDFTPEAGMQYVSVYVSPPNLDYTTYVGTYDITAFPIDFTGPPTTAMDLPQTPQMIGPISGAKGLCSFRAFMLMWRDNVIFRSEGLEPHLFHPDNIMQFDGDVQACEAVKQGMWVGTTTGLWWISGEDSDSWTPLRKFHAPVAIGSIVVPGTKLPILETDEPVALFLSTKGLVAGTSKGHAVHLLEKQYIFPGAARVSFAYTEHTGIYQILAALEG